MEKSAGFLNIDFNQSSFWLFNNLTIIVNFMLRHAKYVLILKKVLSNISYFHKQNVLFWKYYE